MAESKIKVIVCDLIPSLTELFEFQKSLSSLENSWGRLNDEWAMGMHIDNDGVWLWASDGDGVYQERSVRTLPKAIQKSWRETYREYSDVLKGKRPTSDLLDESMREWRSNVKTTLRELKRCLAKCV